jgi:hypothetical protein
MPDMAEAVAIDQQIRESAAYRASARIEGFSHSLFVLSRNFEELRAAIEGACDPAKMLPIWDIHRRGEFDFILMEIRRRLHNYLASAKTSVDQTRVMMRDAYKDHPFLTEYQSEVDRRFKDSSLAAFILGLRNYMLHYSLPATYSHMSIARDPESGNSTIEVEITLKKDSLLLWSSWPPLAIQYLEGAATEIPILSAISPYQQAVIDLHEWLRNELIRLHSNELAWLDEMFRRRDKARGPI